MKLIIPGKPTPQGRMRLSKWGIFDPNKQEKRAVRAEIADHVKRLDIRQLKYPRISFIFHMPIPKATPKKHLELYNSGLLKHDKKPDGDNLMKLYLDCLTGFLYSDDQLVQIGFCVKLYHSEPKTIIYAQETSHMLSHDIEPEIWHLVHDSECAESTYVAKACQLCSSNPQPLDHPRSAEGTSFDYGIVSSKKQRVVRANTELIEKVSPQILRPYA